MFLHSIFDQKQGAKVQTFSKGEQGNTTEQPRPPASQIGSFTNQFHEKDACKVEIVGWKELQGIMFAMSCKNVAQTYMSRVYAFANRRREGESTSFSEESTESVLKMLRLVNKYATGAAIFPNEIREELESDGGIHELEIIERKRAAISTIQGTKLIDVLFSMLAAPRHAGLNRRHIDKEEKVRHCDYDIYASYCEERSDEHKENSKLTRRFAPHLVDAPRYARRSSPGFTWPWPTPLKRRRTITRPKFTSPCSATRRVPRPALASWPSS